MSVAHQASAPSAPSGKVKAAPKVSRLDEIWRYLVMKAETIERSAVGELSPMAKREFKMLCDAAQTINLLALFERDFKNMLTRKIGRPIKMAEAMPHEPTQISDPAPGAPPGPEPDL